MRRLNGLNSAAITSVEITMVSCGGSSWLVSERKGVWVAVTLPKYTAASIALMEIFRAVRSDERAEYRRANDPRDRDSMCLPREPSPW
jgi:hypothetical protein